MVLPITALLISLYLICSYSVYPIHVSVLTYLVGMHSPYIPRRLLLPKVEHLESRRQSSNAQTSTTSLTLSSIPLPPRSRQPKSATRTEQEWEDQKPNFVRLYVEENRPLEEVMKKMEDDYKFKAS